MAKFRRKSVSPGHGRPLPFDPAQGIHFPLSPQGIITRVALMQVLEIYDDYLVCRGFDPECGMLLPRVNVAKPYLLQKTPWEDWEGGYDSAPTTEGDISPPYFVGDVLVACKPQGLLGDTPGTPDKPEGGDELGRTWTVMYDELGNPIQWLDLNAGGRTTSEGRTHWGKLDTDLDYDDTTGVTCSIWALDDDNAWADTTVDIEEVLPPFELAHAMVPSGVNVAIESRGGKWYVSRFPQSYQGTLAGALAVSGTATVTVNGKSFTGCKAGSTQSAEIASTSAVRITLSSDGYYYVTLAPCPAV